MYRAASSGGIVKPVAAVVPMTAYAASRSAGDCRLSTCHSSWAITTGSTSSLIRLSVPDGRTIAFCRGIDGAIAGYLLLDENTIDTVVVSPDLQRRGVGSTIVRFACATLQRRGHEVASLLTSDRNLDAVRLYERRDFRMHCINRWFVRR
jgi:ribosomal protein S18 acetylase RimI-like enzyme